MVVSDGGAVSAEIEGLSEFTNYTVSVQASTSAGIGDSSDLVTVFTDEDGKYLLTGIIIVHTYMYCI